RVRRLLEQSPSVKANINASAESMHGPLITDVQSVEMLDALLDAGADVNARSHWWAGGFGLLDRAKPEVAAHAIERGAVVTVHAAARMVTLERLRNDRTSVV